MNERAKTAGIVLLATAAAAAAVLVLLRDQMDRHQRNLFSPRPLRRLAALGHVSRAEPTVELVNTLRDFIAWEPRRLLRERARSIVQRMEDNLIAPVNAG